MKFMTKIKLNDHVVSKGFGQNKKSSKTAAAQILLEIICPNIHKEWQEKLKALKVQEDGAEVIPMEEVVEYSAEEPHRDASTDVQMEVL